MTDEQITTEAEENRLAKLNYGRMAVRTAKDFAKGGVGGALFGEVKRRSYALARQKGEAMGEQSYNKNKSGNDEQDSERKKLAGVTFWIIFAISIVKEVADILLDLTGVGAILAWILGAIFTFIIWFYLTNQGVTKGSRQLTTWIISAIIELVPFLNIIPTYPFTLIILKIMENSEFLKKRAEKAQGFVSMAGAVGVV